MIIFRAKPIVKVENSEYSYNQTNFLALNLLSLFISSQENFKSKTLVKLTLQEAFSSNSVNVRKISVTPYTICKPLFLSVT